MLRALVMAAVLLAAAVVAANPEEIDLGTIVITPTRIGEGEYEVTGNVTVISGERIAASDARTVPDVLKESVGVLVYDKSTSKTSIVDLRGFGDTASRNVLVLVNGRKINTADISGPDLLQVPLGAVERIEIIRGASSVLYGDNAVGGVINIITKQGEGDLEGSAGVRYGSYDRFEKDLELSGSLRNTSYYVYANYSDDRGYRDNSDVLVKDFQSRISHDWGERASVDINAGWHKDEYGLPGGLNLTELNTIGRRASATPDDFARTKDQFIQATLDVTPFTEDGYLGDVVIDYTYRDRGVFDSFNSFGEYNTLRSLITHGLTGKYIFDRPILGRDVNFVTGIDYYNFENDITGSGSNTDDLTISKDEIGAYGYVQVEVFEDLKANIGTRYQKADYVFNQRAGSVVTEEKGPDEWVSMGGLKYHYQDDSNVYINIQQTFRFLATDEWYSTFSGLNTDLDQQSGLQYELGLKHRFDSGVEVSATTYWIDLENEIFLNPDKGFFGTNDNYEETRRKGLELSARMDLLRIIQWDMFDKLEFYANYAFQSPEFHGGPNDGNDIPMAPRHQAGHGIVLGFFDHYGVSLNGRYVGERYAINDTANATGRHQGYYVVDAKLTYTRPSFDIFLAVNNLLDDEYEPLIVKSTTSAVKDFFPAPERNWDIGVNIKW